jgi:formate hydrogenlyase subunit 3/multisubunit Na+/H+ antiporter MnhD subunit
MTLILTLSLILPLLGAAGVLGISALPRLRDYGRYVAMAVALLTVGLILPLRWSAPQTVVISLWQPSFLLGATLALRLDAVMQPLVLVMAVTTACAFLIELSRPDEFHPTLAAVTLALLSVSAAALWSANVLTMILSWAAYDLLRAIGQIAAGSTVTRVARGLIIGNLSTLLFWGGSVLVQDSGGSTLWSLMTPAAAQLVLWSAAGLVRLAVYPFHLYAPDDL